jgi:hypothetical protein
VGDLGVLIDGVALPEDEARAFWRRFSDWMNEHAGDLAGFAKAEALASVRPEIHDGSPVLVASRTAAQTPYGPAAKKKASSAQGQGDGGRGGRGPSAPGKHAASGKGTGPTRNESSRPVTPARKARNGPRGPRGGR